LTYRIGTNKVPTFQWTPCYVVTFLSTWWRHKFGDFSSLKWSTKITPF